MKSLKSCGYRFIPWIIPAWIYFTRGELQVHRRMFFASFNLRYPRPILTEYWMKFFVSHPRFAPMPFLLRHWVFSLEMTENKRPPLISGAYIIRFFTRRGRRRMTNCNNNNGYILQRTGWSARAAWNTFIAPRDTIESCRMRGGPRCSSLSFTVN